MGANAEPFLSTTDLSEMFQVPLATVYGWNHKGTGPRPIKVGMYVRYSPREVQRWVEAQTAARPAA